MACGFAALQQSVAHGDGNRVAAIGGPELGQDVRDMIGGGLAADAQLRGDLGVSESLPKPQEDIPLAQGEIWEVTGGRRGQVTDVRW